MFYRFKDGIIYINRKKFKAFLKEYGINLLQTYIQDFDLTFYISAEGFDGTASLETMIKIKKKLKSYSKIEEVFIDCSKGEHRIAFVEDDKSSSEFKPVQEE